MALYLIVVYVHGAVRIKADTKAKANYQAFLAYSDVYGGTFHSYLIRSSIRRIEENA